MKTEKNPESIKNFKLNEEELKKVVGGTCGVGNTGDNYEKQADATADKIN